MALKGTSNAWFDRGGGSATRDRFNVPPFNISLNKKLTYQDNLMFSCCCGAVDRTWSPICPCSSLSSMTCSESCVIDHSNRQDSYYNLAQSIYVAIRDMFPPTVAIWLTGHSLGGALCSLVGLTNQVPVFSFESPGDLRYAARIGLLPDTLLERQHLFNRLKIYHFGNDRDPVFMGTCQGTLSTCYWGGYAMETRCHIGKTCQFTSPQSLPETRFNVQGPEGQYLREKGDKQEKQDVKQDIRYHSIEYLITQVLAKTDRIPECIVQSDCTECTQWTYT